MDYPIKSTLPVNLLNQGTLNLGFPSAFTAFHNIEKDKNDISSRHATDNEQINNHSGSAHCSTAYGSKIGH